MDAQEKRTAAIFGMDEVPDVNDETLRTYLRYIKDNIDTACEITGICQRRPEIVCLMAV